MAPTTRSTGAGIDPVVSDDEDDASRMVAEEEQRSLTSFWQKWVRAVVEYEQHERERALQAALAKRHSTRRWLARWRTSHAASTRLQRRLMQAMRLRQSKQSRSTMQLTARLALVRWSAPARVKRMEMHVETRVQMKLMRSALDAQAQHQNDQRAELEWRMREVEAKANTQENGMNALEFSTMANAGGIDELHTRVTDLSAVVLKNLG
jgi:hypothetical protein